MTSPALQRAMLLQQQNRHPDAVRELHQHLSQTPRDAFAHALLADSLLEMEQFDDAQREAQEAVGIAPDEAFGHAAMAAVLHRRNRFKTAENAIRQAIAIDQANPHYFGRLGAIQLDLRRWRDALDAADQGLSIDPKDATCLNVRGMALTQLGERQAASETTEGALADDPENAFTHANHGWTLLHRNKPKEAMEHFREALRLDPTLDFARAGIVEAMKARNPFYRLMLRYFLFMSRLDRRVMWGIIIGGYFGYQILSDIADQSPEAAPYIRPVLWAYIAFALSTWLASTLFNLLLRFHPFGKYALSVEQRLTSTITAALLAAAIGFGVAHLVTGEPWTFFAALVALMISLPTAFLFGTPRGWPRWTLAGVILVLLAVGVTATVQLVSDERAAIKTFQMFAYGCLFSQIAAPALGQVRPTR